METILFGGELNNQLKIWLCIGIYIVPMASIFFGIVLKFIARSFSKVGLSVGRAIFIEFIVNLLCWVFMLFLIFVSQLVYIQVLWQTGNGVASIFIRAVVYSKMIKHSELGQIGFQKALKLSALITLIAIAVRIPVSLLESIKSLQRMAYSPR
jgi:hypothetical protein